MGNKHKYFLMTTIMIFLFLTTPFVTGVNHDQSENISENSNQSQISRIENDKRFGSNSLFTTTTDHSYGSNLVADFQTDGGPDGFNEAIDNYEVNMSTSGDKNWNTTTQTTYQDGDALVSGQVLGGEESTLKIEVNGTGILSFYLKANYDNDDYMYLDIYVSGGDSISEPNSGFNWTFYEIILDEPGLNYIEITYDSWLVDTNSTERAWIDAVSWTAFPPGLEVTGTDSSQYTSGDNGYVYWASNGTSEYVRIDWYQLGTHITTATSSRTNSYGYYYFSTPDLSLGTYQIRVTSKNNESLYDEVDVEITNPYLNITNPTLSTHWEVDVQQEILWDYIGDDYVTVELHLNGSFLSEITQYGTNGDHYWTPSSTLELGTGYQIKLIYSSNITVTDISEEFELVEKRTISITSPSSTSVWTNGSTQTITWSTNGSISNVNISLYEQNVYLQDIVTITNNDGSYTWNIPSNLNYSDSYTVRIFDSTDGGVYGVSDQFIISPPVKVLNPVQGDLVRNESTVVIEWFAISSITEVNIQIYIQGSYHSTLATNYANNGTFNWFTGNNLPESSNYTIRIEDASDQTVFSYSGQFDLDYYDISFNNAIDNYDIDISFSNEPWIPQNVTTYDGVDAIKSAPIDDSEETQIIFTVFGTGTFSFYFMLDAESGDSLRWYVDGVNQGGLGGSYPWTQKSTTFTTSGWHTVAISYEKDYSGSSGADAGYVDQVVWTPDPDNIIVDSPKEGNELYGGHLTNIEWQSNGSIPYVSVQLFKENSFVMNLSSYMSNTGNYQWNISETIITNDFYEIRIIDNSNSSVFGSSGNFTIYKYISPNEALDNPSLSISTNWVGQSNNSSDGVDALYSKERSAGSTTRVTITVYGPGYLTFYWKSTSNYFNFYIDSESKFITSGGFNWTQETVNITGGGEHTLVWLFDVDFDSSLGDKAWLDQVVWEPEEKSIFNVQMSKDTYIGTEDLVVTWNSTGFIPKVNFYLIKNGVKVAEALDLTNDGKVILQQPSSGLEYGTYTISIESSSNSTIKGESQPFKIAPPPSLNLNSLEDEYSIGDIIKIRWDGTSSISNVTIKLMQNGLVSTTIVSSTPNNGSFDWQIPNSITTGDYSIEIQDVDSALKDTSGTFSIIEKSQSSPEDEDEQDDDPDQDDGSFFSTLPFPSIIGMIILLNMISLAVKRVQKKT